MPSFVSRKVELHMKQSKEHCVHSFFNPQDFFLSFFLPFLAISLAVTENGQQGELKAHQAF